MLHEEKGKNVCQDPHPKKEKKDLKSNRKINSREQEIALFYQLIGVRGKKPLNIN